MDSKRIARPTLGRTTRHLTVDPRFAGVLADDFPALGAAAIGDALYRYPRKGAIEVCAWATSCDEPKKALRAWAKKNRPRRPKLGTCDGCGGGFDSRDLVELHEDNHDNLTYFHGDRLCRGCAEWAGVIR